MERLKLNIQEIAANFINQESNRKTMITVTDISLSRDCKNATIFITAFPDDQEHAALDFLKRKRPEFRDYFKARANMKIIPFFDFAVDEGEKNRQRVDSLLSESPKNSMRD